MMVMKLVIKKRATKRVKHTQKSGEGSDENCDYAFDLNNI